MHFIKTGCNSKNLPVSGFQNYFQTKSNLHISICQTQFTYVSSLWDTLYEHWQTVNILEHLPTYLPRLVNVVCKRPQSKNTYEYQIIIFKIFYLFFLFLLQTSTVKRKRWASDKVTEWLMWIERCYSGSFLEPNPWNLWFSGKNSRCFHQLSEVKWLSIGQFDQTHIGNAKLFSFSRCWQVCNYLGQVGCGASNSGVKLFIYKINVLQGNLCVFCELT